MNKPTEFDTATLVVELREQQREHWLRGERLLVETLLDSHPQLRAEEDCITELLYAEFLLREEMEEVPDPKEYFGRFPEYEPRLERLFEVHRALECEPAWADGEDTFGASLDSSVASPPLDNAHSDRNTPLQSEELASESPQPEFGLGRFGDYELLEEIARGGMGVVYRAKHLPADRIVALKMILAGQFAADEEIERFRSEAQAAANLDHPNIVPIYDVGRLGRRDYFSMGFVDGPSLAERIAEGPLPPREAAELMRDVSRAIHCAHQRGIVHRDLKPANVLIDEEGAPKITDFGLAKTLHAAGPTVTGDVIGTPSYMSPEQATAAAEQIGPASDIYSLGAVLYCLLTGRPPFQAATVVDTLVQVVALEPVSPKRLNVAVDRDLETICLKCLEKEPQRRYASAADVADELERWLAGEPITARPISRVERAWRWCRRRPLVAGLAATAVGLTLAIGVLLVAGYFYESHLRQDADSARQRADENAQQARQQSQLALQTLEAVIFDIQRKLQHVPASHQLRREMLNSVLDRLDQVAHSLETGPRADHHRAVVHVELGDMFLRIVQVEEGATSRALQQFQRANDIFRQLAAADPDDSLVTTNLAVSHGKLSEVHRQLGNLGAALDEQQRGLDLLERLHDLKPRNISIMERLSDAYSKLGELHFALSDLEAARTAHQQSLQLVVELAADQPDSAQYQRDLSVAYSRLAAIAVRQGRLQDAHEFFEDCLRIQHELSESAGDELTNVQAACDLSSTLRQFGDLCLQQLSVDQAREHYQQSLLIARRAAKVDGDNAQVTRCLERALTKVGEMALRNGIAAEAQRHLEEALALQQQRADADSADFGAAVELLGIRMGLAQSHQQLGNLIVARDMYLAGVEQYEQWFREGRRSRVVDENLCTACLRLGETYQQLGELDKARQYYARELELERQLAEEDPSDLSRHRGVSVALGRVGDVALARREVARALEYYQDSLAIAERLAQSDPQNGEAQRDQLISLGRLARAQRMAGDNNAAADTLRQVLTIAQQLAASAPEDPRSQSDLATAYIALADVHRAAGKAHDARESLEQALAIRRNLAERDASDLDAQYRLSIVYERLFDLHWAGDNVQAALSNIRQCLAIRTTLLDESPQEARFQRGMLIAEERLASALRYAGDLSAAADVGQRAVAMALQMVDADPQDEQAQADLITIMFQHGITLQQQFEFEAAIDHFQSALEKVQRLKDQGVLERRVELNHHPAHLQIHIDTCRQFQQVAADIGFVLSQPAEKVPSLLYHRAVILAYRGQHVAAADAATRLSELDPADDGQLYNAACAFALCSGAVTPSEAGNSPQDDDQRAAYARRALQLLNEIRARGFFDDPTRAAWAAKDPDLGSLHESEEFRRFLDAL